MKRRVFLSADICKVILMLGMVLCVPLARLIADDSILGSEIPGFGLPKSGGSPKEIIPPAPDGMILDRANVLQPEAVARLRSRLVGATSGGVAVYVVTIPSLEVPPSKRVDRLDELAKAYAEAWIAKTIGAVVLFDDESGLMTVLLSNETDRRFASFAVEMELKEPLSKAQESGLARDKLERSAQIVADSLSEHKADAVRKDRRNLIGNTVMTIIAILGLGLALMSIFPKPKSVAANVDRARPL